MANKNPNTSGLKRGHPKGTKLKQGVPKRDDVLAWFIGREGQMPGSGNALEDALIRLHEHAVTSNSSASSEYIISQIIGSPKSTIKQEVPDSKVFEAYAESMAELGYSEEDAVRLTELAVSKIKGE